MQSHEHHQSHVMFYISDWNFLIAVSILLMWPKFKKHEHNVTNLNWISISSYLIWIWRYQLLQNLLFVHNIFALSGCWIISLFARWRWRTYMRILMSIFTKYFHLLEELVSTVRRISCIDTVFFCFVCWRLFFLYKLHTPHTDREVKRNNTHNM